ncbi:DUF4365 domain-containing protein [Micromonospora yasonensis]|uniref:DUF4365 domain-containing protein n=1 Tax=Micromonospora yasonensis TaxID=1128667 RepID=UPI0022303043|nr:DUF4365 domain-containing protein [Micromonospora yasonensis]MCW3844397.1 DUF4365 domain-containing protein [Micromonospora yasonensis]
MKRASGGQMRAETWQKEQISCAYLHAIAAREGLTIASWNVDKDGVDATIRRGGPMVDLQLKCTQKAREVANGHAFDLDVATYDKLRAADRSAPGYLAVVIVPADIEQWIVHDEEQILLRCRAYYACIQDAPEASGETTVAIHLPRENKLDGKALDLMIDHSRRRILGALAGGLA